VDHRPTRFAWAKLNAYGILLAGLAVLGVADLIHPGNADLARLVGSIPPGQPFWTAGYVVAGLLLLWGFVRTDRLAETFGLCLLTLSLISQGVVAWALLGWVDYTTTRIVVLVIVAGCSWARISALWSRDGLTITIPARRNDR
jgi:hypothetical protein